MAAVAEQIQPTNQHPLDVEQTRFKFAGTDILGAETKMYVYASDEEQAEAKLLRARIEVESIAHKPQRLSLKRKRLTREQLGTFSIQLAERTRASDPIPQAIQDIARSTNISLLREALLDVWSEMRKESINIDEAFNTRADVFPEAFRHIIHVGIKKGDPSDMLQKYGQRQLLTAANIAKIRGALIYPAVVLSLASSIIWILVTWVLPSMEGMYKALLDASGGAQLPLLTRGLLGLSSFLTSYLGMACILLAVIGFIAVIRWLRTDNGRDWFQRKSLHWPLVGNLIRQFNAAHVIDLMSILAPVIPPAEFLNEAAAASLNVIYKEKLDAIREGFRDGGLDLQTAFTPYAFLFGDEFQAAVATGEQTGRLPDQLANYAALMDRRVQESTAKLSKMVEPLTLVVAGCIIGLIVIAAYYPLFDLVGQLANKH